MKPDQTQVDEIVESILATRKYRNISEDLIRDVASSEIPKRRDLKEAIKATKSKLHQVAGVYMSGAIDYDSLLLELSDAASSGDMRRLRKACIAAMRLHPSTRERIGILDQFYHVSLSNLPPVRSVLDVGCGFNPLSIPWMGLSQGVEYYAYDVYHDLASFLNRALPILGVSGHAYVCDVIQSPPARQADLALVLKTLPCMEQIDRSAGIGLLRAINASYLLVSYPTHSLGGRDRQMPENYEARFLDLIRGANWSVKRFEFETELAFLVTK
jgi:16S rRNA (guanine(1405)-N(7))-methyltransferase